MLECKQYVLGKVFEIAEVITDSLGVGYIIFTIRFETLISFYCAGYFMTTMQ